MTSPTITENFSIYGLEILNVRTQPWKRPAVLRERLLPRLQGRLPMMTVSLTATWHVSRFNQHTQTLSLALCSERNAVLLAFEGHVMSKQRQTIAN